MSGEQPAESGGQTGYSKNKERIASKIDELVLQHHKQDIEELTISVKGLATRLEKKRYWLNNNNFPNFMDHDYQSCTYEPYTGLIIDIPAYIEERGLQHD